MALTLNTSHPLYANLKLLVCVDDDGSVKDLVTPSRTVTLDTGVTVGSGTYGRHVKTLRGPDNYTPRRISWTPLDVTRTGTAFVVVNDITSLVGETSGRVALAGASATKHTLIVPAAGADNTLVGRCNNSGLVSTATPAVAGSILSQGALSLATGFDVSVGGKVWKDGVLGVTDAALSTTTDVGNIAAAGGRRTVGVFAAEFVWIAIFDRILTDAEVADLHGSLGASNAFALVSAGVPPSGTVTIGTITPSSTSASVPYTYSASDQTGFEYRLNGGTAASIGASPATISGLTAGTPYSLEVRAINAAGAGAWSAAANFTTEAEGPGNLPPSFDGPSIAAISATEGVALSALDVSSRFSDAESALTFSAVGSWPAGVTVSSAGVISGTPTTAGTYSGLQVRATDAGALTADSNTFSITVAAAALPSTITVTEPLKNNTGTTLANRSGVGVAFLRAEDFTYGLTTDASGILAPITDAAIVTGQQYHVVIKLADGSVGITGPITAS